MTKDDNFFIEEEGRMPEPAPGKKVISFALPETSTPVKRAPKKSKEKQPPVAAETDFSVYNKEDYQHLSTTPRRRAREASLMVLFAVSAGTAWQLAEQILVDASVEGANAEFALALAKRAWDAAAESDLLLASYAREWDVARFPAVDRSILRLAVAELLDDQEQNQNIIINEAVELGKKFGAGESSSFINGILDNIYNHEIKGRAQRMQEDAASVAAAEEAAPNAPPPAKEEQ